MNNPQQSMSDLKAKEIISKKAIISKESARMYVFLKRLELSIFRFVKLIKSLENIEPCFFYCNFIEFIL